MYVYPAILVFGGTISPLIGGGGSSLPLLGWNDVYSAILVLGALFHPLFVWGPYSTPFGME